MGFFSGTAKPVNLGGNRTKRPLTSWLGVACASAAKAPVRGIICWNSDSEGGENGMVIVMASRSVMKVKHRVHSAKDFNSSSEVFRHNTRVNINAWRWGWVQRIRAKSPSRELNSVAVTTLLFLGSTAPGPTTTSGVSTNATSFGGAVKIAVRSNLIENPSASAAHIIGDSGCARGAGARVRVWVGENGDALLRLDESGVTGVPRDRVDICPGRTRDETDPALLIHVLRLTSSNREKKKYGMERRGMEG
ncbi:hypothetical protein M405DRAFT_846826 [Rhizopogon salebrosus TDB-379]|nr:hypothetical protein M405DRAFT_846826 [Rhizopogon salebrosus TDB-379]